MSEEKPSDLIDVQINGEWYSFPKGTRMIEACRQAGVEVPHYCYHPKLSSPGNCRMCLVEMGMPPRPMPGADPPEPDESGHLPIGWIPRPVIACANTIAPNMGIRTEGPLTEECRKGVMEMLLVNHPLDCPICDQAGECTLQEFSVEHGRGESRFREQKVKKPKNVDVGPRIRLDDERCIMCSRCIRFCEEVADDPVLGFTDRGSHTVLTVHPGRELANNYSLNTVDICPVGALTSNDFRFQMRVWFMRETKSIDVHCGTGCNITVHSRENKIYRIVPRRNNEVNSDWMPDSHRLDYHWIDSEARLAEPLLKDEGGKHRLASWSEALARSAERLAAFGKGEVAVVASARMSNEELWMAKCLAAQLGAPVPATVAREGEPDGYLVSADRNPNTNGARLILGAEDPSATLAKIEKGVSSGKIKALVVLHEGLLGETDLDAAALGRLDFLLVVGTLAGPLPDLADVVLPASCWAETSGTMVNVTGRLQRLNQAVEAPGLSRETWELLRDLVQALGGGNGIHSVTELFKQVASEVPEFEGLSWGQIGDLGVPVLETGTTIPLLEREKERIAQGIIVG